MRVLHWILGRVEGTATGSEHVFGVSPRYDDLHWQSLEFSPAQFDSVISIDHAAWQQEMKLHDELFRQLAYHLPAELDATRQRIESKLAA